MTYAATGKYAKKKNLESHIDDKRSPTMDDWYKDESNHKVCVKCGFCINCGDCKTYGCQNENK